MSAVVKSLLEFAFGFISNKVRTYGAEKLQDGGLTDQKFRGLIVRELDDVKFKLDADARKDLSASISCLKRGVERLHMSLDESVESGNPSTSELPEDRKQFQDPTNAGASSTEPKSAQKSVAIEDALALANAIGKLKIASSERYESAKESFKKAEEKACEAFHNAALSTEERILASKVRIASGILEHLDDLEFAASDCLLYLRELHDMSDIKEIFEVHLEGGIKSFFNRDSRAEIVETVTMINLILADFISKFTKRRVGVFDWPMIVCDTNVVHPIHYEEESLRKLEEMEITPPWDAVVLKETLAHDDLIALNSKGVLLKLRPFACEPTHRLKKLDTTTGMLMPYCNEPIPQVGALAVDEDDTVYILSGDPMIRYTLSVYSVNVVGRSTHDLEFLKGQFCSFIKLAVTKNKNIVICCNYTKDITLYLCDRSGIWIKKFDTGLKEIPVFSVFVSCDNEIVLATKKLGQDFYFHVYAQDGQLQRTVKLPSNLSDEEYRRMVYNPVTQTIIHGGCYHRHHKILIEYLSHQTSDIQRSYPLHLTDLGFFELLCNTIGELALIRKDRIIFLEKKHQKR